MKLVSVHEMRQVEMAADSAGLSYDQMMENAGHNLARVVRGFSQDHNMGDEIQILGLVGTGNNGGDTLVALARLAEKGWTTRAYLVGRRAGRDPLVVRLENAGGEIHQASDDKDNRQLQAFIETTDILLDGVLGTGIKLPLKGEARHVLGSVQAIIAGLERPPLIVAVDCPSGVDCDTGETAEQTLCADITVTMAAIKQGMLMLPAFTKIGSLRVVDIGLMDSHQFWKQISNKVASENYVRSILPDRQAGAHKGTFGTALVIAGSLNYTGAALLAGKAAYRAGAGLVTLAVPAPLHAALAGHFPEATWLLLPHEMGVIAPGAADVLGKNIEHATAILIGPGLGVDDATKDFLIKYFDGTSNTYHSRMGFLRSKDNHTRAIESYLPPLVIDADGLKLLTKITDWPKILPSPTVLTPHPGEMSILTGLSTDIIQRDRLNIAKRFAMEWGHVVVLKGAFTVIASPEGETVTIPVATAALARAGTGDVLAGIIVGLCAQGVNAFCSAVAGAWIHAQSGLFAAELLGNTTTILASEVLDAVVDAMRNLLKTGPLQKKITPGNLNGTYPVRLFP